ncbi:NAD(P)/FAD-dependent oxidoreductase [Mycobacteroides immunogenum]|uniref:Amino acid dehydrogenase n=1 Tax=Mycobacteroides immunogenum TaxID=83262 RepID=A0A7V8RW16_9MYCO|nr:FAD-dependent oxidoreductase [Mycobacteroides immunogenum]AMT72439.1 amino acid dehydrogenase [Mycobacteroides immunogenum]ANO05596.1 amino acid dehydrogenase [Mycobacteroides immunogenum]KIU41498.1 amino acid dehydrogenase [Mycobacteroides immunogenum]KPG06514.1 amino acid dehydrogenase [Mycobacteroides immunogenum]KPG08299.1 amino acid dehydrogenase [Mycobacteroides immunogenum]
MKSAGSAPKRVVVVGAGMVGLATAWFLQDHGVEVTVVDRNGVAAGASWGNAGFLTPGLAAPLAEPSTLRYGIGSLGKRDAALSIPLMPSLHTLGFLAHFAARCTHRAWQQGVDRLASLNTGALGAFDALVAGGVDCAPRESSIFVGYERAEQSAPLLREVDALARSGVEIAAHRAGADRRPAQFSDAITSVWELTGQRFLEPEPFLQTLAQSIRARGGDIREGVDVRGIRHGSGPVFVDTCSTAPLRADAVVVANGAWISRFARDLGIRVRVQAGRGYSFSVDTGSVAAPLYLPASRIACTPYQGRLRVAGTMEFRGSNAPLDSNRVDAMIRAAAPMLRVRDWDVQDVWVGPRPMSHDNLPLVGATKLPGVYAAGGHGMWGILQGPITGQLLARQIITGVVPPQLEAFSPVR